MTEPADALRDSIARQRADLKQILEAPLRGVAEACASAWPDRAALNATLTRLFPTVPHCRYLYAMNTAGIQISDNIGSRDTIGADDFGRDRSHRPYLRESLPAAGFLLSRSYITLRGRRPGLTAIQIVRDGAGRALGFVGADFYLQDLPLTRARFEERREWRQLKGDPAIRGQVFHQTRSESLMDRHIDTVLGVVEELMTDHGMHHVMLHFSSSRAVYWTVDDPFRYHLLDIAALTDPDICLAFRKQPYPADALVPRERIRAILDALRSLRFVDETFYLRTGTLNLFNGIVGLTFSCDGSHYVPWDEFLKMDVAFWMGTA
ncbi:MAG: PDC sensor domain-containing protein [Pseudomonadota bacterium]